jgi:Fe/S biogenesis protein NfuA
MMTREVLMRKTMAAKLREPLNILVTEAAQDHFRRLLFKEEVDGMNLRMFAANPGTIHADVSVTFCPPGEEELSDTALSFGDFTLFIAEDSEEALAEAKVDFKEDKVGGQLSIKAPYLKGREPPAGSSLKEKIQYAIESEINPNLAGHGGKVSIVEIVEPGIVVLQFGGGCHGCGMAGVTLKHGIEKTLKEKFPEIIEIRDATDHTTGENPYY